MLILKQEDYNKIVDHAKRTPERGMRTAWRLCGR